MALNEAWVTDIPYVPTGDGWLYVAGVKDLYTCELVGHALGARMTTELTARALLNAVATKRPAPGLIHHSDRGAQYCAHSYRHLLQRFGMKASMSRKGNCYDNAPMDDCMDAGGRATQEAKAESFWGTLKNELVHQRRYEIRAQAIREIDEYITVFYNRQRRHSRLGNLSPAAFTQAVLSAAAGGRNVVTYGVRLFRLSSLYKKGLWVCLEEQFSDAARLLKNPSHQVARPVNVEEFHRSLEEAQKEPLRGLWLNRDKILNVMLSVVVAALVAAAVIAVLSHNNFFEPTP